MSSITKTIERKGSSSTPFTRRYPKVIGGTCEFCGVLDRNVEGYKQYQLCEHYRGKQLWCTYCPQEKNPDEVITHSILNVADSPDNPNELVVWCNSFKCSEKHLQRFDRSKT